MNFVQQYKLAIISEEDIDEYIDVWYNSDINQTLYEFLGFTLEDYNKWILGIYTLDEILGINKNN